jgi:hypothetical protein
MRGRFVAIACWTTAACSAGAPATRRTPPTATTATATAQPIASTTVGAAQPDVATAAPASRKSTPGTIACGASTCDATHQLCCNNERCVEQREVVAYIKAHASDDEERRTLGGGCPLDDEWKRAAAACDDAGDCADGAACCEGGRATEFVSTQCAASPCFQVCSGPGGCTPGYHCELEPNSRGVVKGYCRFSDAKVTCGGELCGKDRPICCDPMADERDEGATSQCIATFGSCEGGGKRRACRRHADCGDGRQCCGLNMGETMCMPSCSTGVGDLVVCETIADCPRVGPRAPKSCTGDEHLKWCDYEAPR